MLKSEIERVMSLKPRAQIQWPDMPQVVVSVLDQAERLPLADALAVLEWVRSIPAAIEARKVIADKNSKR